MQLHKVNKGRKGLKAIQCKNYWRTVTVLFLPKKKKNKKLLGLVNSFPSSTPGGLMHLVNSFLLVFFFLFPQRSIDAQLIGRSKWRKEQNHTVLNARNKKILFCSTLHSILKIKAPLTGSQITKKIATMLMTLFRHFFCIQAQKRPQGILFYCF